MPVKSCLLFLYQMILFEFGPMNPKNHAAENSKKCKRYGNSIQQYSTMLYEKSGQFFFPIQTLLLTYIPEEGGNCIDIDVEQMAGVVKNSTLKTQNDTLLDSVYTYFSMREVSTISYTYKNCRFLLYFMVNNDLYFFSTIFEI